ncbi:MAG: DUF4364 family protein [Eubacteriales bacterium]|nr:DUF4364 family protein [Eubacteriales bacterium]
MSETMERMYMLMVLYLIKHSGPALSNTQIMEFFPSNKYADYFKVQAVITDLTDRRFVIPVKKDHRTTYFITEAGNKALEQLDHFIPPAIMDDLKIYLKTVNR